MEERTNAYSLRNYEKYGLEFVKTFAEDVYSVAVHPSGFQLLIGFSDKLRLVNILMNDFGKVTELDIRACRECRFSNGGQFFAAANQSVVQIFNTYTFENMGNLRGHNGKVWSIHWSLDDHKIVTGGRSFFFSVRVGLKLVSGLDGAVYEWNVRDFKRTGENVQKTCLYSSVIGTEDNKIYAVGKGGLHASQKVSWSEKHQQALIGS